MISFEQFKKYVNIERKKGGWYQAYNVSVDGKEVRLKAYKTWLQVYKVDGVDWSNCMGVSVKQFNQDLVAPFNKP